MKGQPLDNQISLLCERKNADNTEHHNHFLQGDFRYAGLMEKIKSGNVQDAIDYVMKQLALPEDHFDFESQYTKTRDLMSQGYDYINSHTPYVLQPASYLSDAEKAALQAKGKPATNGNRSSLTADQKQILRDANITPPQEYQQPDKLGDKNHITLSEVERQGTAEYRVLQLFNLGVAELQAIKNAPSNEAKHEHLQKAFFFLGIMCHYEGDKGQPFHASGASYDGQAWHPTTSPEEMQKDIQANKPFLTAQGVHHAFEEGILEYEAKMSGQGNKNSTQHLWLIPAVHDAVMKSAHGYLSENGGSVTALGKNVDIVKENIKQVITGIPYMDPIQDAYFKVNHGTGGEDPHTHPSDRPPKTKDQQAAQDKLNKAFSESDIQVNGRKMKVMDAAHERMGRAAGLLARIYKTALQNAMSPELQGYFEKCKSNAPIPYDGAYAVHNYPPHDYINNVAKTIGEPAPAKDPKFDVGACKSADNNRVSNPPHRRNRNGVDSTAHAATTRK